MLIGYDNNADGDIADAGDDLQVVDLFSSNAITLTYDNDGNLTADGLLAYVYDGWNRLVEVERSAAGDTTTVATYAYDGKTRRVSKVVTNNGNSGTPNDGGNATIHFYYCGVGGTGNMGGTGVSPVGWNICETRNGSNQTTRQWVWGTKYTDEILFMDVNGDPTESNDCDPDAQGGESTYDRRCFYHQDRNWNVVALTEYGDGVGTDARLIERYAYTPYGQFIVLKGDTASGELANALHVSSVGNPFTHQGLGFDHEKSSYQNRWREYVAGLQRFAQRDPLGYARLRFKASRHYHDGMSLYIYLAGNTTRFTDPSGMSYSDPCQKGCSDAHRIHMLVCACIPRIRLIKLIKCIACLHSASVTCTKSCSAGGVQFPKGSGTFVDCSTSALPRACASVLYGRAHSKCMK